MTEEHHVPDFDDALYGGLAGGFAAMVRAVQTPVTPRQLSAVIGVGVVFGAAGTPLIEWAWPSVPVIIAVMASLGIGYAAKEVSTLFLRLVNAASERAGERLEKEIGGQPDDGTVKPPLAKPDAKGDGHAGDTATGPARGGVPVGSG